MTTSAHLDLLSRIDGLRDELIELAFALERGGNPGAADVAHTLRARIGELRTEFSKPCPEQAGSFVE